VELDPQERILHLLLIRFYQDAGRWEDALLALDNAGSRFPDDFNLDLLRAKALIHTGDAREATEILAGTHVLPSENAQESHLLWEQAHTLVALDALESGQHDPARTHLLAALDWPESLGQGRPYEPEERLARFLLALAHYGLGDDRAGNRAMGAVVEASDLADEARWIASPAPLDLLTLEAMKSAGRAEEVSTLEELHREVWDELRRGLADTLEGRMVRRALAMGRDP
jgi:tetratricopeptide (TPR) repeat protein